MKRLSKMTRKYAIIGLSMSAIGNDELRRTFLNEMDMYVRIQSAIRNPKRAEVGELYWNLLTSHSSSSIRGRMP